MLSPKRIKFRKIQKGNLGGKATKGNQVSFGQYGLQALVAPVEAHGETLYRVRLLVRSKDQTDSLVTTFLRAEKLKVWIVALP
jgi:ribosomal protein L16/L10AE